MSRILTASCNPSGHLFQLVLEVSQNGFTSASQWGRSGAGEESRKELDHGRWAVQFESGPPSGYQGTLGEEVEISGIHRVEHHAGPYVWELMRSINSAQ